MKRLGILYVMFFACGLTAAAGTAERTWLEITGAGVFTRTETVDAAPGALVPQPFGYAPPEVLWTHNEADTIYQTNARFGYGGRYVFAGSATNDCAAQLFSTSGSGNVDWEVEAGTSVYTAAARDKDAFCAGFTGGTANDIKFFRAASSTPAWTHTPSGGETVRGPVAMPADGSFVAAIISAGSETKLRILKADNGSLVDEKAVTGTPQRGPLVVTPDGKFILFRVSTMLHVFGFNGTTLTLRESVNAGSSTDCHGLSHDGLYLVHGFTTTTVRRWNGSTYAVLFVHSESGFYSGRAVLDGADHLYNAWYRPDFKQARIVCHTLPSSTPTWTFNYKEVTGSYQDLINEMAVTDDGKYLVAASLGNQDNLNPEMEIFNGLTGDYLFGVDTPGSMACCDVAISGSNVYATAAGKHVHFNQMGRGGDIYAIRLDDDVPVAGPDSFTACPAGGAVAVSWRGSWRELAGFNLYREGADITADAGRVKLNDAPVTGRSPYSFVDKDVSPGVAYRYWLEAVALNGEREAFGPAEVRLPTKRAAFALYQNAPNPARGATAFAFSLAEGGPAALAVYDLAGREVWRHEGTFAAGENELDATFDLAPGVYVYRLRAGDEAAAKKMVVIK
jgi:hypothetical protein